MWDWFPDVFRACAYVYDQECGSLTSGNIVGFFDNYCRLNEVVDVDVTGSSWVYWDVNDLLGTFCKRNGVVHQSHGWDKVLTWCEEGGWVPGVIVKDCIGQIADAL